MPKNIFGVPFKDPDSSVTRLAQLPGLKSKAVALSSAASIINAGKHVIDMVESGWDKLEESLLTLIKSLFSSVGLTFNPGDPLSLFKAQTETQRIALQRFWGRRETLEPEDVTDLISAFQESEVQSVDGQEVSSE